MTEIGSYEAKTHLPKLLARVARGERITITRRGVPVAELVPPTKTSTADVGAVVERMLTARKGRTLGEGLTARQLIEEGRRF